MNPLTATAASTPGASQASELAGSQLVSSLTLLGKVSATLIFIIVLILACAWLFRRIGNAWVPQTANRIRVITSASLGGKERVVVVDVEGKRLVLGVGPGSVNCLAESAIPESEQPQQLAGETASETSSQGKSSPFARIFNKYKNSSQTDAANSTKGKKGNDVT